MSDLKLRGGHRAMATKLISSIRTLVKETELDPVELSAYVNELKRHRDIIFQFDSKIQEGLDEQLLLDDMGECSHRTIEMERAIGMAEVCLQEVKDSRNSAKSIGSSVGKSSVKLPTLHLPSFDGNPLDYSHFWDIFNSSVHSRTDISDVQKFTYLMGQLRGEALELLDGFTTTEANYKEAIQLLKDSFGDPRRIIQSHLYALFDLETPKANAEDLSKFRSSFECHLRGLKVLNTKIEEGGFIISALLLRKLPSKVRDNINRGARDNYWELKEFRDAINEEIRLLQAIEPEKAAEKKAQNKMKNVWKDSKHSTARNTTVGNFGIHQTTESDRKDDQIKVNCKLCFRNHVYSSCSTYETPKARSERARSLNLCLKCLLNNHRAKECKANIRCRVCQGDHNSAFCYKREFSVTASTSVSEAEGIALAIANMNIKTKEGIKGIRALFDQGSQQTFILRSLVHSLGITSTGSRELSIDGFRSVGKREIYEQVSLLVKTRHQLVEVSALVVDQLPSRVYIPGLEETNQNLMKLGYEVADPEVRDRVEDISMLVGADQYYKFITGHKYVNGVNLLSSKLGNMLVGKLPKTGIKEDFTSNVLTVLDIAETYHSRARDEDLEKLWKLDSMGIKVENDETKEECLRGFEENISYQNGRYVARLPWRNNHSPLPTNLGLAKTRLRSLLNKLRKTPDSLEEYNRLVSDQLKHGFIEKIDPQEALPEGAKIHYLAHFGVRRESDTTPLRIVYDCSAGRTSLNDCLITGPSLMEDMGQILLRFRFGKFACSGDIEKAFLNISLHEKDRDSTRFLWPENPFDPNSKWNHFRFKVVLFGATCSQFLLNASIRYHLKLIDSPIVKSILLNLYVDNLIGSFDTREDMEAFHKECNTIFSAAGLSLRKWATNDEITQTAWNASTPGINLKTSTTVLGLYWELKTDRLGITALKVPPEANTKRKVLSAIAKIFDPLGIINPITIRAKIFLQDLWKEKHAWDDPLSEIHLRRWHEIATDINASLKYTVPRSILTARTFELHAFSDASKRAYGTSIYVLEKGHIPWLVMSRAKVAPLKTLTLPQLELMAVVLSARLLKYVRDGYQEMNIMKSHIWTDSQISYYWIRQGGQKKVKPFVKNRVSEIHLLLPQFEIHYVPSYDNPADCLSRGITARALWRSDMWLHGPSWLTDEISWPPPPEHPRDVEEYCVAARIVQEPLFPFRNFSKMKKLLKVTVLVLRFLKKIKGKETSSSAFSKMDDGIKWNHHISGIEVKEAEKCLIREAQREEFPEELNYLMGSTKRRGGLVNQLNLFLKNEIVCCRRRIEFASVNEATIYPILLPREHPYTNLVIDDLHHKNGHVGLNQMLVLISGRFHIPRARQVIRRRLRSCILCKRQQGTPYHSAPTPPLPRTRLIDARPFTVTGVDYTGSLLVKEGRKTFKTYVVLFTCAASRAVHLELASDLTSSSFLNALRRFISRRSSPSLLISDNATNFKLSAKFLSTFQNQPTVQEYLQNQRLEWKFIPAKAPWFGGFWERLIGLMKNTMKKVLGQALVTREELETILTEVEYILNNRPLTYVDGSLDYDPLTPSDLLYGFKLCEMPFSLENMDEKVTFDTKILTRRQRYLLELKDKMWMRWKDEYLTSLRSFIQKNKSYRFPVPGEIVLIKGGTKRSTWVLGKIARLHPGVDGYTRSADVETHHGVVSRPIVHLYPLELNVERTEE